MARTSIHSSLIASSASTFVGLGRNRIINGDIAIDQLSEGGAITANSASVTYAVDMFSGVGTATSGVFTLTRSTSTPPTGHSYFLRASCTTADASLAAADLYAVSHFIEGFNCRDFAFGSANAITVTLSFWVRSSLTGTYTGALSNLNGNRAYPFAYTTSVADTWEQKTVTIAGDQSGTWAVDAGVFLRVRWALAIGSDSQGTVNTWGAANYYGTSSQVNFMPSNTSRTWDITGVQLEVGSYATRFEYRPYQIELALCRRYYEKTFPAGVAVAQNCGTQRSSLCYRPNVAGVSTANAVPWCFQVEKRSNPTIVLYNTNNTNTNWRNSTDGADSGASSAIGSGERHATIGNAQAAGDALGEVLLVHATADSRL